MNVTEALAYLRSANRAFCKPGLDRVSALCQALGLLEELPPVIHVAGTNGKGSFCALLSSVLRAAGYRVGVFSSPGVKRFSEVITVDGEEIGDEALAALVTEIRPVADGMEDRPTEFEITVALALSHFKRAFCDVIVIEAGMGGRGDATNLIPTALLSVITGVSLDHTAFLGDTVAAIAKEKAGIIKPGRPVLYGGKDEVAAKVIRTAADEMGAPFYTVDPSRLQTERATLEGTDICVPPFGRLHLSLLGLYQPRNALTVLTAVEILRDLGLTVSDEAVRNGLAATRWRARFEIIARDPLVIYDGAHNAEGIDAAVESIRHYFGERGVYLMTGVLRDKEHTYIARRLAEVGLRAFVISPSNPRALPAEDYAAELASFGLPSQAYPTVAEAFSAAKQAAREDGVPLLCLGSLYTYAELVL